VLLLSARRLPAVVPLNNLPHELHAIPGVPIHDIAAHHVSCPLCCCACCLVCSSAACAGLFGALGTVHAAGLFGALRTLHAITPQTALVCCYPTLCRIWCRPAHLRPSSFVHRSANLEKVAIPSTQMASQRRRHARATWVLAWSSVCSMRWGKVILSCGSRSWLLPVSMWMVATPPSVRCGLRCSKR
jgi:hypothetical protein